MTSETQLAERWAKQFLPRPRARARLFCFPYAGAGAAALRRWMMLFPEDIEVRPIEYPGRWTREGEPLCDRMDGLVDGVAQALPPLLDLPYAVMGYSLGALVAYEWLRSVERAGLTPARVFFACAQRAPHLPSPGPPISMLSDSELMQTMERIYGPTPGPVLDPALVARSMPPLRADLRARESYQFEPGSPLSVPLRAFGGMSDPSVSQQDLDAWREHTRADFTAATFPGGHFFITTAGAALRDAILRNLPLAGLNDHE